MRKITSLIFFSLAFVFVSVSQESDSGMVLLSGTIYKVADSASVTGNILYEKLPYYDDMGMAMSKSDGSYELPLVKGEKYNLTITKEGFKKYVKQITLEDSQSMDIYLKEDRVELIKLEELIFARGSDQISPSSFAELDDLANFLKDNPGIIIQLEGHTDFAGNAEANMRLSAARVEAVQKYLNTKKVKKNRIFTKAFGGTRPLSRERTDEAKSKNRRVEVRFIRR